MILELSPKLGYMITVQILVGTNKMLPCTINRVHSTSDIGILVYLRAYENNSSLRFKG